MKTSTCQIRFRAQYSESMTDFAAEIQNFIATYTYYARWSDLEAAVRTLCNNQLSLKSAEIVRLSDENRSIHKTVLEQSETFHESPDDPFPITLVHHNQHQQVIALTRIGRKKDKTKFSDTEKTALKTLHRYLNQQVQYCKDRYIITANLEQQTQAFNAARQEVSQIGRVKDNFLSIASHELRTPMSVIRGYADFLLSGKFGPLNDQQKNFLQKILANVNHLTKLVNDMLDVHKLEAGKMEFVRESVSLRKLLEESVSEHQILLQEKQQTLTFFNPQNVEPTLETDPEKVRLVLANLISNAYKFTPRKGNIEVCLQPQPESDLWLVQVIDDGIGVSANDKNGLFEKFQQVDNSLQKKYTGTGLGLSICREIIQALGGEIWIEDNAKAKSGSIFNFTLPA